MAIDLIDTIKPKNNGTFPMVEAEDVVVGKGTAEEKRLPEALEGKLTEEEADARYLKLAGGTVRGAVTFGGNIKSYRLDAGNAPVVDISVIRRKDIPDWVLPGDGLTASADDTDKVTLAVKPATSTTIGGVKVGEGLTVAEDGTLSATGTGVAIDTSMPASPADDHVPSTKLMDSKWPNGDMNSITLMRSLDGNVKVELVNPATSASDYFYFDTNYFNNSNRSVLPKKSYVDAALAAKQDKLVAGEGITIAADGKTISATGGGEILIQESPDLLYLKDVDNNTFELDFVGTGDTDHVNLSKVCYGRTVERTLPTKTYVDTALAEKASKSYVDGLIGDIGAALAAI